MTDAADLACRFLALWEDYLTALFSASPESELSPLLTEVAAAFAGKSGSREPATEKYARQPGPPPGAEAVPGASRQREDALAELSRRLGELEQRVAAVERNEPTAPCARRRNRRARA